MTLILLTLSELKKEVLVCALLSLPAMRPSMKQLASTCEKRSSSPFSRWLVSSPKSYRYLPTFLNS